MTETVVAQVRCDRCLRPTTHPIPCEGDWLCETCVDVYLAAALADRKAEWYGEQHRHTPADRLPIQVRVR